MPYFHYFKILSAQSFLLMKCPSNKADSNFYLSSLSLKWLLVGNCPNRVYTHRPAMLEICHQRTPCTIKDHCQVQVLRNVCDRYLLLLVTKMLAVKLDNKVQYRYGDW